MSDAETVSNPGEDWPTRAAETVVGYVDKVRTGTTGKAMVASRWLVYGMVIALVLPILLVVLLIALVRAVTGVLALFSFTGIETGEVWLTYVILGVIFFFLGLILWRKKEK